ncbi:MAG: hypothetical protein WCB70_14855, partial [Xanthobacteraceae bacterium]
MLFVGLKVTLTPASVTAVSKSLLTGCFIGTTLSNTLRVAKLTNCQSILPETMSIGLRRNWPTACRSQMRKADRWQHSPGSRHWRRQRHSLDSFGPWN